MLISTHARALAAMFKPCWSNSALFPTTAFFFAQQCTPAVFICKRIVDGARARDGACRWPSRFAARAPRGAGPATDCPSHCRLLLTWFGLMARVVSESDLPRSNNVSSLCCENAGVFETLPAARSDDALDAGRLR
eukprot:3230703-Pleurochrysis_carterae.AAC.3